MATERDTARRRQLGPSNDRASSDVTTLVGMSSSRPVPISHPSSIGSALPQKKSGLFGASSNLINAIVGAGIIGMPYALKNTGFVAGIILIMLVSGLAEKSLRMLIEMATFHPRLKGKVFTYEDLASYAFGRLGSQLILLNMFLVAYGGMVGYLLIIKDTLPTILGLHNESTWEREIVMICATVTIIVPLSLQRDMASLALTSLISMIADIALVGFIATFSPIEETVSNAGGFGAILRVDSIKGTMFIGVGVVSFAMTCQHIAFGISGSLFNCNTKRWAKVTGVSTSVAFLLCVIMGITGYLGYLNAAQGNILNNFAKGSVEANIARGLLCFTMFFTYPMEAFVARHVLMKLMFEGEMDDDVDKDHSGCLGYFRRRRVFWTLLLYVSTVIPSLFFDDLGPVLSITGSIAGSFISYIAPGFIYIGLNGDAFLEWNADLLGNRSGKYSDERSNDTNFLPVEGDANQQMTQKELSEDQFTGCKPLWWYLCGFSIWCRIALRGSVSMREKLDQNSVGFPSLPKGEADNALGDFEEDGVTDVFQPVKKDFVLSMFLILFGITALVAGVGTNIYVQVGGSLDAES